MERPVKVCCFCETWESGGIESFLHNVLLRMDFSSTQVDIVAARLGESVFTKPLQQHGVRFFELSGSPRKVCANHRAFRQLLKEREYDVVHLNAFQGLSLAYGYLAKQAGVAVRIAHSHNTALRKSVTRPVKLAIHIWAKKRFAQYATALWACSKGAAEFLFSKKHLKKKGFQWIPNGIAVERFQFDGAVRETVREELGLRDKLVIGNVGRLCGQKNQAFLLDVLAQVIREEPEGRLLLIGEGPDETALRCKARRLNLADKVIFYGISGHVERLLWAMDVFAFPSRFEGLGIAAMEAQAAGLPVLCSEHVPEEAYVTPICQALALNTGPAQWARSLLSWSGGGLETRSDGVTAVQRAGFEVADVAKQIESFYKRSLSHGVS